ncbi:hypothetical protein GRJ2_001073200 [Grus japonensis]|uniref:Uncharacterized protein n=1 Tax=Grus japonensis TaxID=30415 RepID=A0ABC9WKV5_GRUJA
MQLSPEAWVSHVKGTEVGSDGIQEGPLAGLMPAGGCWAHWPPLPGHRPLCGLASAKGHGLRLKDVRSLSYVASGTSWEPFEELQAFAQDKQSNCSA